MYDWQLDADWATTASGVQFDEKSLTSLLSQDVKCNNAAMYTSNVVDAVVEMIFSYCQNVKRDYGGFRRVTHGEVRRMW